MKNGLWKKLARFVLGIMQLKKSPENDYLLEIASRERSFSPKIGNMNIKSKITKTQQRKCSAELGVDIIRVKIQRNALIFGYTVIETPIKSIMLHFQVGLLAFLFAVIFVNSETIGTYWIRLICCFFPKTVGYILSWHWLNKRGRNMRNMNKRGGNMWVSLLCSTFWIL